MKRDGFSLIELIVSMLLLSVVALSIGGVTARLASSTARGTQSLAALDLADDRLRAIQSDPSYTSLESRYGGAESAITGFPGLVRTTVLTHVQRTLPNSRLLDYKIAVVSITGTGLRAAVTRSVAVAAP